MAESNSIDTTECNSIECNEASNLNNQQFRLNKINEIKDYFIAEIKEEDLASILLLLIISINLYLFYQQQVVAFLLHHLQQLLEHL